MEATCAEDMQVFIGYFEEPEPGVPTGYTGWYHSGGKFPIHSPQQVFFTPAERGRTLVRDEVAGPFTCHHDALADLEECLGQSESAELCLAQA